MDGVHRREAHFRVLRGQGARASGKLYEIAGKYQGTVITKFDAVTMESEVWLSVSASEAIDAEQDLKLQGLWRDGEAEPEMATL